MKYTDLVLPLCISLFVAGVFFFSLSFFFRAIDQRQSQAWTLASLDKYSISKGSPAITRRDSESFNYKLIPSFIRRHITKSLESIHSNLKYELVLSQLLLFWAVVTFLLALTTGALVIAMFLALGLTGLAFRLLIQEVSKRQMVNFQEELPGLLNILVGSLRAGLSLHQSLEAYVVENSGEVATQLRRALSEISIGNPIDSALMGVAERMHSDDLKWTVTALTIQKTVGGSMATILETAYDTVRGRAEINREVRTISAEGRLSAYVLMALPFGIFSFMFFSRRSYIQIFWTEPVGLLLLAFIGVSLAVGWIWMRKVVEIRI